MSHDDPSRPKRQGPNPAARDPQPDVTCINWRESGGVQVGGHEYAVRGRALALIRWIALNQDRLNESRGETGQFFATWKGEHFISITGHVKIIF